MSPEKVTIIDRDGWDPIGSIISSEEEKLEAKKNIENIYKRFGINLKLHQLTFIDIF